jgi:hypothetical protein
MFFICRTSNYLSPIAPVIQKNHKNSTYQSKMNAPTTTTAASTKKSVHFSPLIEVQQVRYPKDLNVAELWTSRQDNDRFAHAMIQDVIRSSNALAAGAFNQQNKNTAAFKEDVINCVGLEHLLVARNLPQRALAIRAERSKHIQNVLHAQYRLQEIAEVIEEDISHTSEVSSYQARYRARVFAHVAASVAEV